jgi:hypothetical protein
MLIVYDLKTKEMRLALTNQLIAQLDLRVNVLIRQKATLEMCKQDTARIDEQLRYVSDAFATTRAIQKKLQIELAVHIGAC